MSDLKVIASVLYTYIGRTQYSTYLLKGENINVIVKAFGLGNFLKEAEIYARKKETFNPTTLKYLATTILLSKHFSHMVLQVAIADVMHMFNREKWMNNCTVPLQINIPSSDNQGGIAQFLVKDARRGKDSQQISDNGNDDNFKEYLNTTIPCIINIYSYQEYSETWEQAEACTLDYTHIINNLYTQIT